MPVLKRAACLFWLGATVSASASQPFDGAWHVNVATQNGNCGNYSSELLISEGHIGTAPGMLISGSGNVSRRGRVVVDFVAGSSSIKASGQARRAAAQGRWQSPALSCSGTWQAVRAPKTGMHS